MPENTNIIDFLAKTLTGPFVYVPNAGNAGDALMACATYDIFDKFGIKYSEINHAFLHDPKGIAGKTIVLAGGGNFNERGYNTYAELLPRLQHLAAHVIVLPHTINGNEQILSSLTANVTLICREEVSFEHTQKFAKNARVLLADDMAFNLDIAASLSYRPRYIVSIFRKLITRSIDKKASQSYPRLKDYKNGLLHTLERNRSINHSHEVAYLFRQDIESTGIAIPKNNIDASEKFNYGVTSSLKAHYTVHHLLKFLSTYKVIHTNRLHIGIASALLGKDVHLYPNNYYKCRAVYEHSIRQKFSNVIWHD